MIFNEKESTPMFAILKYYKINATLHFLIPLGNELVILTNSIFQSTVRNKVQHYNAYLNLKIKQ